MSDVWSATGAYAGRLRAQAGWKPFGRGRSDCADDLAGTLARIEPEVAAIHAVGARRYAEVRYFSILACTAPHLRTRAFRLKSGLFGSKIPL